MNFRNLCWFFPLFLFSVFTVKAQSTLPVYAEPEVQIKVKTDGAWSYDFGISHRNLIYSEDFVFEEIQMELTHTTNYALNERDKIGAGVYYRFREIFSSSYQNELRFLQQYNHSVKYNSVKTAHRFRFEQRFRENTTFRLRYRLSAAVPLSDEETKKKWFLTAHTETLWSMAKTSIPALGQRFALGFEKEIGANTELSVGAEYKYKDYTHDPESELFFNVGFSIEL